MIGETVLDPQGDRVYVVYLPFSVPWRPEVTFHRFAPLVMALALGVPASSGAVIYGPSSTPRKSTRIVLQAVVVEVQLGHGSVFAPLGDFRGPRRGPPRGIFPWRKKILEISSF